MFRNKSYYQFDEDTGFWGRPNLTQDYVSDYDNEKIRVYQNQYGFRDLNEPIDPEERNIVAIGGSHSWGAGVQTEERYSELLSKKVNRRVVNMGQASLGIDQISIAIMKKTEIFNPEIIIVEQYPWALLRISNNFVNGYIKPSFNLSGDKLKLDKVPYLARYKIYRSIFGNYRAYKKQLQEYNSGINLANYDPMFDPIFFIWKSSYYEYLYRLAKKILVVIRDYCQEKEIKLLFVLGTVHQELRGDESDVQSSLIDYGLPRKRLIELLKELDINYVDTSSEMLRQNSKDDPVTFNDGHINQKGHKLFANILKNHLEEVGWV